MSSVSPVFITESPGSPLTPCETHTHTKTVGGGWEERTLVASPSSPGARGFLSQMDTGWGHQQGSGPLEGTETLLTGLRCLESPRGQSLQLETWVEFICH